MNKKIKLILLLTGAFGLQRVFAGWQPVPYVGLEIDPMKSVTMVFPRVDSASGTSAFDEFRNEITLGEFIFGQSDVLLQGDVKYEVRHQNFSDSQRLMLVV